MCSNVILKISFNFNIDLCRSHAQCGENGECAYNRTEMRYQCQCREGFVKDSLESECKPGPDAGCDVLNNCDVNGRCVWESDISKFTCECKPGFLGNGFVCQEDMNGCNVLNNCARNAECVYDVLTKGFRCRCREVFNSKAQALGFLNELSLRGSMGMDNSVEHQNLVIKIARFVISMQNVYRIRKLENGNANARRQA